MSLQSSGQRIAVVGSGISGLTAAHLLSRSNDVTLFEANDYIGGHTHTVPVTMGDQRLWIDTGFIVCNDRNYPNFLKLMDIVGIPLQKTEMSFSVNNPVLNLEYNGHSLNTLFAQRRNLLRPRFYRFVSDIVKFNAAAKAEAAQLQNDNSAPALTLDRFVRQLNLGDWFRDNYLLPMVAAIWSCSVRQAGEFPLAFFLRFFLNHGLLDIKNRPQWYVLAGGSHSYVKPLLAPLADRVHLNAQVKRILPGSNAVSLQVGEESLSFDQVIVACHSDQALNLLDSPSDDEQQILSALQYQENRVTLHTDLRIMPRRRSAWASWNFLAGQPDEDRLPRVTYCMNILQNLQSREPLLVSLNADDVIAEDKILQQFCYAHPVYSTASHHAQQQRQRICGTRRVHYCGAYWYSGFHEDGVRSALDVCARFGESL